MPGRARQSRPTAARKPSRSFVAELMAETIVYGGLLATRAEAYADALDATGCCKAADLFAFGVRARLARPEDAGRPTLAAFRAYEAAKAS